MDIEMILLVVVPLTAFTTALFLTSWLGKNRINMGLVAVGLALAGFTGAMFFGLDQATGWDGLGYVMALLGISAPAAAGSLIGGAYGLVQKEKATHA